MATTNPADVLLPSIPQIIEAERIAIQGVWDQSAILRSRAVVEIPDSQISVTGSKVTFIADDTTVTASNSSATILGTPVSANKITLTETSKEIVNKGIDFEISKWAFNSNLDLTSIMARNMERKMVNELESAIIEEAVAYSDTYDVSGSATNFSLDVVYDGAAQYWGNIGVTRVPATLFVSPKTYTRLRKDNTLVDQLIFNPNNPAVTGTFPMLGGYPVVEAPVLGTSPYTDGTNTVTSLLVADESILLYIKESESMNGDEAVQYDQANRKYRFANDLSFVVHTLRNDPKPVVRIVTKP